MNRGALNIDNSKHQNMLTIQDEDLPSAKRCTQELEKDETEAERKTPQQFPCRGVLTGLPKIP